MCVCVCVCVYPDSECQEFTLTAPLSPDLVASLDASSPTACVAISITQDVTLESAIVIAESSPETPPKTVCVCER